MSGLLYDNNLGRAPGHACACGCRQCRKGAGTIDRLARRSLSAALAHAQDGRFEAPSGAEAGHPRRLTLPGTFSGWRDPVPLMRVIGRAQPAPPADFTKRNRFLLYRIARRGEARPLYIGMAPAASVQGRVSSHVLPVIAPPGRPAGRTPNPATSEVARLQQEVAAEFRADRRLAAITVQIGSVSPDPGTPLDTKLLRAFEVTLQVRERPKSYVGSAWTFEEKQP